jgi:hypothetical protein
MANKFSFETLMMMTGLNYPTQEQKAVAQQQMMLQQQQVAQQQLPPPQAPM